MQAPGARFSVRFAGQLICGGLLSLTLFCSSKTPLLLTTARSVWPSPLKSPAARETGLLPAAKLRADWNVPLPLPNSTETEADRLLATARSNLPSLLKSAATTEIGPDAAL